MSRMKELSFVRVVRGYPLIGFVLNPTTQKDGISMNAKNVDFMESTTLCTRINLLHWDIEVSMIAQSMNLPGLARRRRIG